MSLPIVAESEEALQNLGPDLEPLPERVSTPSALRSIHEQFLHNDDASAANRVSVQELVDFVPPYDPKELRSRGQGDRFNVNFGMVTSIVNEAVGSYLDIFTTPTSLMEFALDSDVKDTERGQWSAIMSEEFTNMIRAWDASTPLMLLLNNILCTHGIGIPWFEDQNNIFFEVGGLDDFKFDDDAIAIASRVEATTILRTISIPRLYAKIEDQEDVDEDGYNSDGWHVEMVKTLIRNAQPGDSSESGWSYEEFQRKVKANRVTGGKNLPDVQLIYGFIQELDGTYSVYAAAEANQQEAAPFNTPSEATQEKFVFRRRSAYRDANQAFQIFSFGVGNKNLIHTIRGLAYYLYEAGQADNVMKCKTLDAARHRASEVYQPSGGVDAEKDMQMVDIGHAVIVPPSLKGVQTAAGQALDKTIAPANEAIQQVMDRHSGGLSQNSLLQNPGARRNELQIAAELDHLSKLLSFAISLYYPPYEKLLRELARRAFFEEQTDLGAIRLVKDMKRRCIDRGVPKDMFKKIDLKSSKVTRVMGAGSRGTRMLIFTQLSQLFSSMDPQGQEFFNFDWATEMVGHDKAVRYFGRPGERRGHEDIETARLENAHLLEGDFIEITEGQNNMVHLEIHLEEGLEPELQNLEEGVVELSDFVLNNVTAFQHVVDHLEVTTVHESLLPKLNGMRQRVQQVGEIIENGLRELNAERRRAGEEIIQPGEDGKITTEDLQTQQAEQEIANKQLEASTKLQMMVVEANAKIEMMQRKAEAEIEMFRQKEMAKIATLDAEAAAKLNRANILAAAKGQ